MYFISTLFKNECIFVTIQLYLFTLSWNFQFLEFATITFLVGSNPTQSAQDVKTIFLRRQNGKSMLWQHLVLAGKSFAT